MMETRDLWGELPDADRTRSPQTLLAEQAVLLGQKTGNVLEGKMETKAAPSDQIWATLSIVAPSLGGYRYPVCKLEYPVLMLYPLLINDYVNARKFKCSDEKELIEAIEQILTSEPLRKVISALLRRSQESG